MKLFFLCAAAAVLFSCAQRSEELKTGDLLALLEKAKEFDESFVYIREITNQFAKSGGYDRVITFLGAWVDAHPDDSYISYYLLRIADSYIKLDSKPIAVVYFDIIVRNHPDLIVRGESIHLACLKQLTNLVDNPEQKIWYYEQLILRFADKIDLGTMYFMQGQAYEELGSWEEAISSYRNFMPFYGTIIAGFPDAYGYAKQMIDFNTMLKNYGGSETKLDRTFPTLNAATSAVRAALAESNVWRLWSYRARVNFFARPWSSIGSSEEADTDFTISSLSSAELIRCDAELSAGSGLNDAYLRTLGWAKFSSVWYFYFRKIYFPMDAEINGRWEWAGIYYGEHF